MKKVKGNKRYQRPRIEYMSHGDITYSTGDIINTSVVTAVTDGYDTYRGEHTIRHINVQSLCCTAETNRILGPLYLNKNFF